MLPKQKDLKGKNITLEKIKNKDIKQLHQMLSDKVLTSEAGLKTHTSIKQTVAFIAERTTFLISKNEYLYGIYNGKELVGIINLFNVEHLNKSGELGYFIGSNYQRKGFMSEALILLSNYLLNNTFIETIHLYIDITNTASLALIKKFNLIEKASTFEKDLADNLVEMRHFIINKEIWFNYLFYYK